MVGIILLLLLSSCATVERMESDSSYRDSVAAHYAEHLRYLAEFDTVYVHDSVFIREAGDSVYVFKYRDRYRYRDRAVHDTINRTDTVTKTQTIVRTITKTIKSPPTATRSPLSLRERLRACLTGGLGGFLLAIILYVVLRLAFK